MQRARRRLLLLFSNWLTVILFFSLLCLLIYYVSLVDDCVLVVELWVGEKKKRMACANKQDGDNRVNWTSADVWRFDRCNACPCVGGRYTKRKKKKLLNNNNIREWSTRWKTSVVPHTHTQREEKTKQNGVGKKKEKKKCVLCWRLEFGETRTTKQRNEYVTSANESSFSTVRRQLAADRFRRQRRPCKHTSDHLTVDRHSLRKK